MARASQGKETHAFEAGYAAGAPSKKEKSASQLASVAKKMFPNGHVAQALKKVQGKVPMQPEKTTSLDGLVSDADKRSEELAEVHDRSSVGETDAASDSGIVDVSNLRGMLDDLVSKSTEEKKSLIQDLTDKDVMDKQVVRATLFTSKHLEEVNSQQKQKISELSNLLNQMSDKRKSLLDELTALKAQIASQTAAAAAADKSRASAPQKSTKAKKCVATAFTEGDFVGDFHLYALGSHSYGSQDARESKSATRQLKSIRVNEGCVAIVYEKSKFTGRPAVFQGGSYSGGDITNMGYAIVKIGSIRVLSTQDVAPVQIHRHQQCKAAGALLGKVDQSSCSALAATDPKCQESKSFMWGPQTWKTKGCFCCNEVGGGKMTADWSVYTTKGS
jgi:regulator of replication initiation timing